MELARVASNMVWDNKVGRNQSVKPLCSLKRGLALRGCLSAAGQLLEHTPVQPDPDEVWQD